MVSFWEHYTHDFRTIEYSTLFFLQGENDLSSPMIGRYSCTDERICATRFQLYDRSFYGSSGGKIPYRKRPFQYGGRIYFMLVGDK